MNEEKIGKYVKTMYIITYSVFLAVGLIFTVIGVISLIGALAALDGEAVNYTILLGVLLIVLGLIIVVGGIFWLVYFIRLPESPIVLKDGKLTFIKAGIQCSPTEVENFNTKSHGLDGAIFGFGKIFLTVRRSYTFRSFSVRLRAGTPVGMMAWWSVTFELSNTFLLLGILAFNREAVSSV